jgi:hypothetical protein
MRKAMDRVMKASSTGARLPSSKAEFVAPTGYGCCFLLVGVSSWRDDGAAAIVKNGFSIIFVELPLMEFTQLNPLGFFC